MEITNKHKAISGILTILVVATLILAGPANAFHLGLSGFKNTPYDEGEVISFTGSLDIESEEIINVQNVSLRVNDLTVCVFDLSGNPIEGCDGIAISLISNSLDYGYGYGAISYIRAWNGSDRASDAGDYYGYDFGYGYGFSGGELVYNISIETPQEYLNVPGNNDLQLIANTEDQEFNSRTEKIVLKKADHDNGNGNGNGNNGNNQGNGQNNNGEGIVVQNTTNPGNNGNGQGNGNGNSGNNGNGQGNGNNGIVVVNSTNTNGNGNGNSGNNGNGNNGNNGNGRR